MTTEVFWNMSKERSLVFPTGESLLGKVLKVQVPLELQGRYVLINQSSIENIIKCM